MQEAVAVVDHQVDHQEEVWAEQVAEATVLLLELQTIYLQMVAQILVEAAEQPTLGGDNIMEAVELED
jgi:hypothetical protein